MWGHSHSLPHISKFDKNSRNTSYKVTLLKTAASAVLLETHLGST
jgi:hypothetical protein